MGDAEQEAGVTRKGVAIDKKPGTEWLSGYNGRTVLGMWQQASGKYFEGPEGKV